jgi:hypothetical protein
MAQSRRKRGAPGYLDQSRSFINSLVLVIPLLAVYEAALFRSNFSVRNQFDFISCFIADRGFNGLLIFNALLFLAALIAVAYLEKRRRFDPAVWPGIVTEGIAYALVLGSCVMLILPAQGWQNTQPPTQTPLLVNIGLAVGAGVYEELFFRLLVLGMLYTWLTHTVRLDKFLALACALGVSSALFSLSHFTMPAIADFEPRAFIFRFIAGIVLGGIFVVRGLGVAIYTHAIYNILVVLKPL